MVSRQAGSASILRPVLSDGLAESFSSPAVFWLPGQEADKRAGLLQFDPGRSPRAILDEGWPDEAAEVFEEIRLVGGTDNPLMRYQNGRMFRAAVWGATIGDKQEPFSLLNVWDLFANTGFGGAHSYHQRRLLSGLLVAGDHLHNLDRLVRINAKHSSLGAAMSPEGLDRKHWRSNAPDGPGVDLTYRLPEPSCVKLSRSTTLAVGFGYSTPGAVDLEPDGHRMSIKLLPSVTVENTTAQPYEAFWRDYLEPVGSLISFAANGRGGWIGVSGWIEGAERPVHVFHQEIVALDRFPVLDQLGINFYLNRLGDYHFPRIVKRWFELHKEFEQPILAGMQALGEESRAERARLFAIALEGLSDTCEGHLVARMTDARWRALKKSLRLVLEEHELDLQLVGEFRNLIVRPTLLEQLGAVVDSIRDDKVEVPSQYEADGLKDLVAVRNRMSHRQAGQTPLEPGQVRDAAERGERLFRAIGLRLLPLRATSRRAAIRRVLDGEPPRMS